jgi:uncharacterized damage-inducible protein DinB
MVTVLTDVLTDGGRPALSSESHPTISRAIPASARPRSAGGIHTSCDRAGELVARTRSTVQSRSERNTQDFEIAGDDCEQHTRRRQVIPDKRASRLITYPVRVTVADLKSDLVGHLERLNQTVLYKLEGLSEYDMRRPMTPTATNLLGVAMHLASLQAEYFGTTFGRPFPREDEFYFLTDPDADPQDDLWVRSESTSEWVLGLYRETWDHARETFATLDLDAPGQIPTRPYTEVTLGEMLVHMVDETARHAGHMDIMRESIDGAVGRHGGDGNIIDGYDWATYRERVESGAREAQELTES